MTPEDQTHANADLDLYWGIKLSLGCFLGAWAVLIVLSLLERKPTPTPKPAVKPWVSMVDEHNDLTKH